jgi:hypothetical protein
LCDSWTAAQHLVLQALVPGTSIQHQQPLSRQHCTPPLSPKLQVDNRVLEAVMSIVSEREEQVASRKAEAFAAELFAAAERRDSARGERAEEERRSRWAARPGCKHRGRPGAVRLPGGRA